MNPQSKPSKDFVLPPNGLFEIPPPPPRPDYVAMRVPVKSIRIGMWRKEEVLLDKQLEFFFKTRAVRKPKVSHSEEDSQLVFSKIPDRCDVGKTSGAPCIGFGGALLRFVFNLLGIFQNECDMDDNLRWT
ncbi:uncharacterized protein LOC26535685 [Drosophila yakuba]|uniref:Uncharacterized protein n=1 Tax=Drosophila yakuba TaxID=7245 RepID=A0A0R1E8X3_DROYA|nr:uncharacterized protein LOC26535685 [Drosophila yakuba]KRK05804.1 uncharacterized protein Dyak_GE28504 [Drosophila yakuba]